LYNLHCLRNLPQLVKFLSGCGQEKIIMNEQDITVVDSAPTSEAVETPATQADPTPVENIAAAEPAHATDNAAAGEGVSIHNLQIGQRLTGKVKNIDEFGAFVDIGKAHDGMVHNSE
jgi:polyribonucleotide nucleotidyltransferase